MMHLRPRSFSELIDATFHIVRARFRALATTAALVMLPIMAFTLLSSMLSGSASTTTVGGNTVAVQSGPVLTSTAAKATATILMVPLGILALVMYVLGIGAMIFIASRAYLGESVEVGPALARARRRFWTLLRATIAKYIRSVGALLLLFILAAVMMPAMGTSAGGGAAAVPIFLLMPVAMVWAIVLLLRYAVTGPVVLNEEVSGSEALTRSAALTKGSKGRLFGIFLVMVIIMYAVMITTLYLGVFVLRNMMFAQALSSITSLVTYPVAAVLITVIYYDLRIRNEGFDLEVMAGGLSDQAVLPPLGASARQPA